LSSRRPRTTVDAVIIEPQKRVVLIKRKNPPFQGYWAIPGGFVELGEKVEDAVKREANEETGLNIEIIKLLGVYSDPNRDPRGHTISIVYLCKKKNPNEPPKGGSDAAEAKIFSREEAVNLQLAFDHNIILRDAFRLADEEQLW